jgi:hypothetical protein
MIDLIENTKPMTGRCSIAPSRLRPFPSPGQPKAHDGAVLAALAVSFDTVLVCR